MPYALILIGAVLLVSGVRGSQGDLWALVKGDFTENGGFLAWVAAIAVVGGIGYIPRLKPLSVAFMTLLLVVLVLSNGGVFDKLQQFIKSGAAPAGGGGSGSGIPDLRGATNDLAQVAGNLLKTFESAATVAAVAA